ncbi:hypothetical protein [Daejeonella oryzae]|uniref:hypothetical protein n=1 Tax=Daejeonella oryzae TaxID=1122943 RepID=UPI00041181F3|nr:hypothetical protein [Daejeonella oryzae]
MKRLILLSLLALFTASACKKDQKKEINKPVSEQLHGTWLTISENSAYFDASNNKVFEQNSTPGTKVIINENINKFDNQDKAVFSSAYSVSNVNGKNYISFTQNGSTQTYEVVYVDTKMMTWKQEKTNQTYNDNGEKVASKQVTTINFHCPCRD